MGRGRCRLCSAAVTLFGALEGMRHERSWELISLFCDLARRCNGPLRALRKGEGAGDGE